MRSRRSGGADADRSPIDVSPRSLTPGLAAVVIIVSSLPSADYRTALLPPGTKVDLLVVEKSARRLSIYDHGQLLRSYTVALGPRPVGPKRRQGDHRTPEGRYLIDHHNPNSVFHLSLHVSYPSASDSARALAAGYSPGGDVMIHGLRNGIGWIGHAHLSADWTDGCIAVTDTEMDQLYRAVPDGTPIEIRP